jgi:myo-inositol-1(or 4)-monophosphatase
MPRALLPVALAAVDLARDLIRSSPPGKLTPKGDRDMASEVDFAVEGRLREYLSQRTPTIAFLGEETAGGRETQSELVWTLDPVDGTVNFIHGLPLCAVSLALVRRGRPLLGVIDLPFLGDRYTAVEGEGAHHNNQRIRVSTGCSIRDAVVALGDYAVGAHSEEKNRLRFAVAERLATSVLRVRMVGSAAIDLAWVAEGKLDASVTLSNHPWDTAAGVIVAREAGASVIDVDGTDHDLASRNTLAAEPGLIDEIRRLVQMASHHIRETA